VFGLLPLGDGTCKKSFISHPDQLVKDESFCNVCKSPDSMRVSVKKNDQRAGSPAGHCVAATMVGSGEEVSEIRGRRTYAHESRTKQKEVRGAPEGNCDWNPTEV
jgi:hypothetical protein